MLNNPHYVVMVVMANQELTDAAISDVLSQSVPTRLLIVAQDISGPWRDHLQRVAEEAEGRILVWWHSPTLPSLSASWNAALRFVWSTGAEEALVVNADIRLATDTLARLLEGWQATDALFVSAVAVAPEQFLPELPPLNTESRGGPDFSCFLISRACHEMIAFDEQHIPAYAEDLTYHRELLLAGEGHRIFSLNIPYLHVGGGSGTLKAMDPKDRAALSRRIDGSRAYFAIAWGGPPNHERYAIKGDPSSEQDGVTTPELQRIALGLV